MLGGEVSEASREWGARKEEKSVKGWREGMLLFLRIVLLAAIL